MTREAGRIVASATPPARHQPAHTPTNSGSRPAPRLAADTSHQYGPAEWSMSVLVALIWGSSFLWIRIALDDVTAPVVAFARNSFGALALFCLPSARKPVDRADRLPLFGLSLLWMGIPFLMYPLAEGWGNVSSAVTGMVNGGVPLVSAVVAASFARSLPGRRRMLALCIGFVGMVLIAVPAFGDDASVGLGGLGLPAIALIGYALSANLARPYQAKYSSPQLMFHLVAGGALWSLPLGVLGLADSRVTAASAGSLLVLGAVGTGVAFWIYGTLLHRAGPVRGMIAIFFTPIVGTVLGVMFRDETVEVVSVAGMVLVIVGAMLTSRPDT